MPVDPIGTFTRNHPRTGDKQERTAYTPAEAVQLVADGWVEKPTKSPTTTASSTGAEGGSTSGKSGSGK